MASHSMIHRTHHKADALTRLFVCMLVLLAGATSPAAAQEIAITFDDLPVHGQLPPKETRGEVVTAIIAALRAEQVPRVYGFVNGVGEQSDPAASVVLPTWTAAGFLLGNHTWSHLNLNDHSLADFEADTLRNEPVLKREMAGRYWRWLRFPYLAEGDTPEKSTGVRSFLYANAYKIAAVTMSFDDYRFNDPYARCMASGDTGSIARMEQAYLEAASYALAYSRALSVMALHREIPYVLLLHLGAFDAHMLPRLLRLYKMAGFRFVTLDEAEADPFYRPDIDLRSPAAPDNLQAAVAARGLSVPASRTDLTWLDNICR